MQHAGGLCDIGLRVFFDVQFAPLKAAIVAAGSQHGGFVTTCMCHGCLWARLQQRQIYAFAALGSWYYNVTAPGNASLYFDSRSPDGGGSLKDPKYRDPGHVNWCWPGDGSFPSKTDDIDVGAAGMLGLASVTASPLWMERACIDGVDKLGAGGREALMQ